MLRLLDYIDYIWDCVSVPPDSSKKYVLLGFANQGSLTVYLGSDKSCASWRPAEDQKSLSAFMVRVSSFPLHPDSWVILHLTESDIQYKLQVTTSPASELTVITSFHSSHYDILWSSRISSFASVCVVTGSKNSWHGINEVNVCSLFPTPLSWCSFFLIN